MYGEPGEIRAATDILRSEAEIIYCLRVELQQKTPDSCLLLELYNRKYNIGEKLFHNTNHLYVLGLQSE